MLRYVVGKVEPNCKDCAWSSGGFRAAYQSMPLYCKKPLNRQQLVQQGMLRGGVSGDDDQSTLIKAPFANEVKGGAGTIAC